MNAQPARRPDFQTHTAAQIQAISAPAIDWLWHGYLAPGNITLLTAPWKSGKTTLTAALLPRLKDGGHLAGQPARAAHAVVISEESPQQWSLRCRKFDFSTHVLFLCRPFHGPPSTADWLALLDHIRTLQAAAGIDLVVIDPLSALLPRHSENDSAAMLASLGLLQELTTTGLAVLLLHHPRKAESAAGQHARGTGTLSACVDILLEMRHFTTAADSDRRRTLLAYSRHDETPRRQVIELDPAGTDWISHGDVEEEAFSHGWKLLHRILDEADHKRNCQELLADWPIEDGAPSSATLQRWLRRAVAQGQLQRDGKGRANDPYRYWLKTKEPEWANEPWWWADEVARTHQKSKIEDRG